MTPARPLALALALLACSSAPRATPPAAPAVARAALPDAPPARDDGRLPPLARPTRYALSLDLDPREPAYTGAVGIDVAVPAPTRFVVLHARGLAITEATITAGGRALAVAHATRRAVGGREADEELVLTAPEALPAGAARIDLRFRGEYSADLRGLFRVRVGDDWYAFSDFEPTDARRAFPCFDEPALKVPFEVSVTTPDAMVAVANMPEASRADDAARRARTHRFAPTPPVSTYLVSFAAGPFEFYEGARAPVPVRVVTVRGRSALGRLAAETAADHLRVLGDYFARPYPYPKLDLVAVPDFIPGAMENPGLVTFRDTALLLDAERAPTRSKHYVYGIIAHELAHQWFGNLVTMAWWDDLWLNEGFATWAAVRVLDAWRPELGARVEEAVSGAWARENDGLESARAIRTPVVTTSQALESFDALTYNKGAAVLRMLETYEGEDHFRDGVRAYLHAHEWGNATAGDLLQALSAAAGRDLAPIASSFLDQPGVPLVDVQVVCAPGAVASLRLRQSRFTAGRPASPQGPQQNAQRWSVPVCVRFPAARGARTTCALLTGEAQTEALDLPAGRCPAWVHPNADARGYYWYQIPTEGWARLAAAPQLSTVEKLDLLSNLEALVNAGSVPSDAYLGALARLAGDRDPHVAEHVAARFGWVEQTLVSDASRPAFRAWVARLVGARARALGFEGAATEGVAVRDLRRTLLTVVGAYTDDPWALAQAEALAQRYLRDARSVDGDAAAVALPIASRRAGAERFEALRAALDRATTPQDRSMILGALVSFDDPALVRRTYDLVLTDAIRVQDLRVVFGRGGTTAAQRALLLAWAREHIDALQQKLGRNVRGVIGALGGLCDEGPIASAEAFLRERFGGLEGVDRSLRQAGEFARRCAATRARDAERAAAVFARR